jgi:hypothetical protein
MPGVLFQDKTDQKGVSRATCYRALDETGRFAKHLLFEMGKLTWR